MWKRAAWAAALCLTFTAMESAFGQIVPSQLPAPVPSPPVQPDVTLPPPATAPVASVPAFSIVPTTPWFISPEIRKELNLSDKQFSQLREAYIRNQVQYQKEVKGLKEVDAQRRAEELRKFAQSFNDAMFKVAQDILRTDQLLRYNQLSLQYRSWDALSDTAVQTKLRLTPEQIKALRSIGPQLDQSMKDILERSSNNPEAASKLYGQFLLDSRNRIDAILTPQQRQTWNEMLGNPVTFRPAWDEGSNIPANNPRLNNQSQVLPEQ